MPLSGCSQGNVAAGAEHQASTRVSLATKNDVKISADGVAKLSFNFLEELQGDSSLEPGEVKTPPHSPRSHSTEVAAAVPITPSGTPKDLIDLHIKQTLTAKASQPASQMDVQACQEKVRAILELDAIKRREEAIIKKLERDKASQSSEREVDAEKRRREKKERKKLKKLKKAKKAALELHSDDENGTDCLPAKRKKKKKRSKDYGSEDERGSRNEDMRGLASVPGTHYGMMPGGVPHLPPTPFPDAYMGFHPLNPYMHIPRPDFHLQRGVFHPRGRGGMRGALRFPGFRPPYVPRLHSPMLRPQTLPLPSRGHSPILPPADNLIWTTTKPSISYAFNLRDVHTTSNTDDQATGTTSTANVENDKTSPASSSERHKKSKKSSDREKSKRRHSSRKSCERSSRRKIEKIRRSLEKQRKDSSTPEEYRLSRKLQLRKTSDDSVEMWDKEEPKEVDSSPASFKMASKNDSNEEVVETHEQGAGGHTPEGPALPPKLAKKQSDPSNSATNFDMFAESPSPPQRQATLTPPPIKLTEPATDETAPASLTTSGGSAPGPQATEKREAGSPRKKQVKNFSEKPQTVPAVESTKTLDGKFNAVKESSKTHYDEDPSTTPPKRLLPEASLSILKQTTSVEKTSLQKAYEMQTRIDKLLKDNDLDVSVISKIAAKSLEHKRLKEKEAARVSKQNEATASRKPPLAARRSPTPELPKNTNNPFRRSQSRSRQVWRSRSPKRHPSSKSSNFAKGRRGTSVSGSRNRSGSISMNRSRSGEKEKLNKTQRHSKSPHERREHVSKERTPKSPKRRIQKHQRSSEAAAKKAKQKTPLSFNATEFLFPSGEDESSSQKTFFDDDEESSLVPPRKKAKKPAVVQDKDESPDTDDYMDNWENDVVDLDLNSSNACDSSTPMRSSSQEDMEEKLFEARFVNPSPPMVVQQELKAREEEEGTPQMMVKGETPEGNKTLTPPINFMSHVQKPQMSVGRMELFAMQEIYDEFIRSVEESGVDLKSTEEEELLTEEIVGRSSLASETTSSSTSSSTSTSSSSETSNSSSSSSSSYSSSVSSSEESNDALDSFANVTLNSPRPKPKSKTKELTPDFVTILENPLTPPLPITACVIKPEKDEDAASPEPSTPPPLNILDVTQPEPQPVPQHTLPDSAQLPPRETTPVPTPSARAPKAPKSDVARDFKKLKSLEGNLARIQLMRANYDSADEISEELLKMEKLFLHEKNLILQKYAKSSTSNKDTQSASAETTAEAGQQSSEVTAEQEAAAAAASAEANKIFDANREAIKLTISPIKLARKSAVFEKPSAGDEQEEVSKRDADEADFTEKLKKPAKEIAIVKPMMETKNARHSSLQRSRRALSPPALRRAEETLNSRSPNSGYHRERRRSSSRSRLSPQRRQRVRSLSVSPPLRRALGGRYFSPFRRGPSHSNALQQRYRSSGRRSRSRSRSPSRQSSRRRGELSPIHSTRSRRPTSSSYYRKPAQQRSLRDSRSRSRSHPRSPPPPRPHSPFSPPPQSIRRRSYSRDRYSSRSPLPFKPPSPPMRRSLSPHVQRRCSLSPPKRKSSSRHSPRSPRSSRSRSRSPRYEDRRHRRSNSYDRRSPSLQHSYFIQDAAIGGPASSSTSYYYSLSPSRISLDARINIVLNGAPNQDVIRIPPSYESYSNYSQYGGQYMPMPPHADPASYSINYVEHQYEPMAASSSTPPTSSSAHKPIYSSIQTIGASEGMPPGMLPGFCYNEFGNLVGEQQTTSVLKELPKATVAVQKGNVLEIVPNSEVGGDPELATDKVQVRTKQEESITRAWKKEIKSRHAAAAMMRLSRETEGSKSILKKSPAEIKDSVEEESSDQSSKKKVFFEDGIFPNRDSEDEDRKLIEAKVRRRIRRLRKLHDITISADILAGKDSPDSDDPTVDDVPPPPPPPGSPPAHLEQPVYIRPPTPATQLYFHYDPVVNSMYVSQLERPIPPRLLNPKALPPGVVIVANATQSPVSSQSPNGSATAPNIPDANKDSPTLVTVNSSGCTSDSSSPKPIAVSHVQQPDDSSAGKIMPIETIQTENSQTPNKNAFQPIPTNISSAPALPPTLTHHTNPIPCVPPSQCAPSGFMGMRISSFIRLPPSPLSHMSAVVPPHRGQGMPMMGMHPSFHMPPPPAMMHPSNGSPAHHLQHQHLSPSPDFPAPQHHHHIQRTPPYQPQHNPHTNSSPHMHLPTAYPVHQQQPPNLHPHSVHYPHAHHQLPTAAHASPHVHYQRQPAPQFYVQSIPPPPIPPSPIQPSPISASSLLSAPSEGVSSSGAEDTNVQATSSTQAMVSPYNMKQQ